MPKFDISDYKQSYLYKVHHLTRTYDVLIDQRLKQDTGIGLNPYVLLYAVRQHQPSTQQQIAKFLHLTPGAISRQVESAKKHGRLAVRDHEQDRRKQLLEVTPEGLKILKKGEVSIQDILSSIFPSEESRFKYMQTLDEVQQRIDAVKQ